MLNGQARALWTWLCLIVTLLHGGIRAEASFARPDQALGTLVSAASKSPDPMGHGASMSLYDFANGDPVNRFDPDGRYQKDTLKAIDVAAETGIAAAKGALDTLRKFLNNPAQGIQNALDALWQPIQDAGDYYASGKTPLDAIRDASQEAPKVLNEVRDTAQRKLREYQNDPYAFTEDATNFGIGTGLGAGVTGMVGTAGKGLKGLLNPRHDSTERSPQPSVRAAEKPALDKADNDARSTQGAQGGEGDAARVIPDVSQYGRVKLSKGTRGEIWERSKAPDGKVYDPSGVEIKPGEPWQAGHVPGHKFSDAQRRAAEEAWDADMWKAYQRDPDIYRPEKARTNLGHQYESDW